MRVPITWRSAKQDGKLPLNGKCRMAVFAGADNLLNQSYSLGNDLNAVGNRYYNLAPEETISRNITDIIASSCWLPAIS